LHDPLPTIRRCPQSKGWTYDKGNEEFRTRGGRIVECELLLRLLPDVTLDELAIYQDDRCDNLRSVTRKAM
jgi:hypothetical protein